MEKSNSRQITCLFSCFWSMLPWTWVNFSSIRGQTNENWHQFIKCNSKMSVLLTFACVILFSQYKRWLIIPLRQSLTVFTLLMASLSCIIKQTMLMMDSNFKLSWLIWDVTIKTWPTCTETCMDKMIYLSFSSKQALFLNLPIHFCIFLRETVVLWWYFSSLESRCAWFRRIIKRVKYSELVASLP